ncbi:homoserine kinase [bacterium MnTg02]|nr:homoserine kinase [bacterium MnTg02]
MAVYTEVSDEQLSDFVERYELGSLLSFKGIAEGVENTNYLVHTDKGPFILTLYEKRVRREDLPFFLGLLEHLADSGLNCPTPLRDREGQIFSELAGRPAAFVTFLEGLWIRRPQALHCSAVGKVLAELHLRGANFSRTRENALSVSSWRPLYLQFGDEANKIVPGLSEHIQEELNVLESVWPESLPRGIIHADLFPDNVFFLGDKLSGLIDFYFACTDMFAYDLAICLNAWCFEPDNSFNVTKARALLKGYGRVRTIEDEEIEALPMLCRGAALRFLLTRVHDWLNTAAEALVRPKDPLEYFRKLRFHRQVSSAREYGLEHGSD